MIALTSSILEFGSLEELTHVVPWDLVVSEKGISPFPASAAGWIVLILNTTSCHIFGKFRLAGYHDFEKFLSVGCSFYY